MGVSTIDSVFYRHGPATLEVNIKITLMGSTSMHVNFRSRIRAKPF
jgi:hypothetical protein